MAPEAAALQPHEESHIFQELNEISRECGMEQMRRYKAKNIFTFS